MVLSIHAQHMENNRVNSNLCNRNQSKILCDCAKISSDSATQIVVPGHSSGEGRGSEWVQMPHNLGLTE